MKCGRKKEYSRGGRTVNAGKKKEVRRRGKPLRLCDKTMYIRHVYKLSTSTSEVVQVRKSMPAASAATFSSTYM